MVENTLNNEQLVEYVITLAKDVFSETEQNYMPKYKVNKLTVFSGTGSRKTSNKHSGIFTGAIIGMDFILKASINT